MPKFELDSAFSPTADQPAAIEALAPGIEAGERFQTLLGATGTGKTMTMAATIEAVQRPSLVIAHNKTLAAQLCNEFRTYFPRNSVEYFVSYYDYYQPEAYVPSKDLYIEKDSAINQEIDRLRHAATAGLFARRDVVIVASVSCIFGLGSPEVYDENLQTLNKGEMIDREQLLRKLVSIQYTRNDTALVAGHVPGPRRDARDLARLRRDRLPDRAVRRRGRAPAALRPGHRRADRGRPRARRDLARVALQRARGDDRGRGRRDRRASSTPAAPSSSSRASCWSPTGCASAPSTTWRCCASSGFCSGIENYSRILDGRKPGDRPYCLLDYFPDDFVCFIDESHQTVPQIGGMYEGDRSRKQTLVDYGFRLPARWTTGRRRSQEFLSITPQMVFVSATPGEYERTHSPRIVEQIVRPTGIVDPDVEVRETRNQIDDLMNEIRVRVDRDERTLVTTLTKKMSEDLTDYLLEMGFKVRYLHSEIDTLERIQIIRELRLGEYDVLVGRQPAARGPRPARGLAGGDPRRRQGGLPARRDLADPDDRPRRAQRRRQGADVRRQGDRGDAHRDRRDRPPADDPARLQRRARDHPGDDRQGHLRHRRVPHVATPRCPSRAARRQRAATSMPPAEIEHTIVELEEEMLAAAEDLRFEYAAKLRDEIRDLKRELDQAIADGRHAPVS